ncbi:MAG: DoxX family protein [Bacteroidota bacterium]
MKRDNIIYWITTSLFALMMGASGVAYFVVETFTENFAALGFPDYFRMELGAGKILGAILLILPMVPKFLKEWTYAAFGITLISAVIAHLSVGDSIDKIIPIFVAFGLLLTSYIFWNRNQSQKELAV